MTRAAWSLSIRLATEHVERLFGERSGTNISLLEKSESCLVQRAVVGHLISHSCRLRGIFILINAPHGVTEFDRAMLEDLNERLSERISASNSLPGSSNRAPDIPALQPVFTKVDRLTGDEAAIQRCVKEVREIAPIAQSPILCAVSPTTGLEIGIEAARMAICRACAR